MRALLLLVSAAASSSSLALRTVSECEAAGFFPRTLACSSCAALEGMAPLAVSSCQDCCHNDVLLSDRRFGAAALQVFRAQLGSFGGVSEFVENAAPRFPRLSVVDAAVAEPTLAFLEGKGEAPALEVRIGAWKTEQIEEFLRLRLRATAKSASKAT